MFRTTVVAQCRFHLNARKIRVSYKCGVVEGMDTGSVLAIGTYIEYAIRHCQSTGEGRGMSRYMLGHRGRLGAASAPGSVGHTGGDVIL